MKSLSPVLCGLLFLLLLPSCGEPVSNLPTAMGGLDEVVFVEDPRLESDPLYSTVDTLMTAQFGRFIHHVPIFDLLYLPLKDFNRNLSHHRNLLFVGVLDQESEYNDYLKSLLGSENLPKVRESEGVITLRRQNVWSDGQTVNVVVANSYEILQEGIDEAINKLIPKIQASEFNKYRRHVYSLGHNNMINQELLDKHDIKIDIPADYKLHPESNGNFYWFRRTTIDLTGTIMIYHHEYDRAEEVTPSYAIFMRDSLGKKYERSSVPGSYMTTEKLVPALHDTINFAGNFAIKSQGLWRLEHDFKGGPFLNYLVYDKPNNRVIHLDAYVYAPDIRKRKLVRELEAILNTFELPAPETAMNTNE
jgi:hypothetical protein